MNQPADDLARSSANHIELLGAIVLDWHDGPLDGFLWISAPATAWRFQLVAERVEEQDVDSRLYLLFEVPIDLCDRLSSSIGRETEQSSPVLTPAWDFETEEARIAADSVVEELFGVANQKGPELLIRASDMTRIEEIWRWRAPHPTQ